MPELIGPAIARDRLRARLRHLREDQARSIDTVERELGWPESMLGDIESGSGTAQPLEVQALLDYYRADDGGTAGLMALARIARSGRAMARHRLTDEYQQYAGYESEASTISIYQPSLVPGLLQTMEYARAATAAVLGLPPAHPDARARVQIRAERQQVVEDRIAAGAAPEIVAIVEECVLRRPIGGPDVLRGQLAHLVDQSRRAHVSLVILPTGIGGHVGLGGVFELLEFTDERDPALVFVESAASDYLHRGPEITSRYRAKVDSLRTVGRSGDAGLRLVQEVLDSLPS